MQAELSLATLETEGDEEGYGTNNLRNQEKVLKF